MPTIFEIKYPHEAWRKALSLVADLHFIDRECARDDVDEEQRAANIAAHGQMFIGGFCILVSKMERHVYPTDAKKLKQILEIALEWDIAEAVVRQKIRDKHRELSEWLRRERQEWAREDNPHHRHGYQTAA